jgi:hypothetical protein
MCIKSIIFLPVNVYAIKNIEIRKGEKGHEMAQKRGKLKYLRAI